MKKYFLSFVAVMMAIAFSTFAKSPTIKAFAGEKWFVLAPNGDPTKATSYSLYGNGSSMPPCPDGANVCAKLAVPDAGNPNIPNLGTTISTLFRPTP